MTAIEWTWVPDGKGGTKRGETWNPQVGCREVSPACEHCYAAGMAHRGMSPQHRGLTVLRKTGVHWNGSISRVPELLLQPLSWREPRGIFVGSMTDTFYFDKRGPEVYEWAPPDQLPDDEWLRLEASGRFSDEELAGDKPLRVGKGRAGWLLDGCTHDEFPGGDR